MMDEPEIIKELREEFGNNTYSGSFYTESNKGTPYEPDKGMSLKKAFYFILVLLLVTAIILFFISANVQDTNQALMAEKNKFIGTWEVNNLYDSYSSREYWTFYENNSLKKIFYYNLDSYDSRYLSPVINFDTDYINNSLIITSITETNNENFYINWDSFKLENGKLCIKEYYSNNYECYKYQFSTDKTQIDLEYSSYYNLKTLTKSSSPSSFSSIGWENINISSIEPGDLRWDWINLTRSSISYYDDRAPTEWGDIEVGDIIQIGDYESEIYVYIKWIETNEIIGAAYYPNNSFEKSSDLVSYWDFDEGQGYIVFDKSGNNNYGTIYGTNWITGISGRALSFNGLNDYLDLGNTESLNPQNAITLLAWYRPVSFSGTGNDPIIDKGYYEHTTPYYQYHLGVTGDQYNEYPSYAYAAFCFSVATTNNSVGVCTDNGFWIPDEWYFLVGTYDGATVKLYVNGSLIGSQPINGTMLNYGKNVYIGKSCNSWGYLPGTIDEVRIYNRALNQNDIQTLYNDITNRI